MQILLLEDDERISFFLVKGLEENGYQVTLATSAEEARDLFDNNHWNILIVDIMLPGIDGIQFIKMLRYKNILTPIIVISALNDTMDKITALDHGADDYLVKPFHFDELLSRIKALTRRVKYQTAQTVKNELICGDLRIDLDQYKLYKREQLIELSPREFKLLHYLAQHKNKALSRTQILNAVWGIDFENNTNVVDVYISYLRHKIESPSDKYIYTVKSVGYMLQE